MQSNCKLQLLPAESMRQVTSVLRWRSRRSHDIEYRKDGPSKRGHPTRTITGSFAVTCTRIESGDKDVKRTGHDYVPPHGRKPYERVQYKADPATRTRVYAAL